MSGPILCDYYECQHPATLRLSTSDTGGCWYTCLDHYEHVLGIIRERPGQPVLAVPVKDGDR